MEQEGLPMHSPLPLRPLTKPPTTLAAAVKAAQAGRGWKASDLVKHCDITAPEVSRLESGTKATLSGMKILSFARVFADTKATTPLFAEPDTYEGWIALLTELDAKGRARSKRRAA